VSDGAVQCAEVSYIVFAGYLGNGKRFDTSEMMDKDGASEFMCQICFHLYPPFHWISPSLHNFSNLNFDILACPSPEI
jgi:hypothetical protein